MQPPSPRAPIRAEINALLRLAAPLILVRIGNVSMGLVDTAFVGRFSTLELGAVAMGNAIAFAVLSLGMGVTMALEPLVSQALGAGRPAVAARWWRTGLKALAVVAGPIMLLAMAIGYALPRFQVEPDLAERVVAYLWFRLPCTFPMLVSMACRAYLQSNLRLAPLLKAAVAGNITNVIANGALVFGIPAIGLPALGGPGAGVATTCSSAVMAGLLVWEVRRQQRDLPPAPEEPGTRPASSQLLRLGLPLGLGMMAEIGVFSLTGVLAGRLGELQAGAHQIAINLATFTFMMAIGLGAACSVRVGRAVGRGDPDGARRAGLTAMVLSVGVMSISALGFATLRGHLIALFTDDAVLIELGAGLLGVAALFQLFDGLQAVSSAALRGAGDVLTPFVVNVVGHWAFGFPIALYLAFSVGLGVKGLWYGLVAGLTAVALTLASRFLWLSAPGAGRLRALEPPPT